MKTKPIQPLAWATDQDLIEELASRPNTDFAIIVHGQNPDRWELEKSNHLDWNDQIRLFKIALSYLEAT